MKKILSLLIIFLLPIEMFSQTKVTDSSIKKVIIKSVPETLMTQIGISCEEFEGPNRFSYFKIVQLNNNNKDESEKILALQKAFEKHIDAIYPPTMLDVRAKIFIIYKSGKIDSVCLAGVNIYSSNGKNMSFDKTAYETVRHIIWDVTRRRP